MRIKFDKKQICRVSKQVNPVFIRVFMALGAKHAPGRWFPHVTSRIDMTRRPVVMLLLEMQMPAVARRVAAPEPVITKTTPVRVERPDDVLIHVRFHPNADVALVDGERPQHISLKDWYMRLRLEAADCYRTFAGGRGFFRIPRETFDAIVSKAAVDSSLKAGLASPDWNTSPPR